MEFRLLRADEIEARVSTVRKNGCSILLYKDARCDMNILDETVGIENWQRSHELIDGQLFCNVGVRVEHEDGTMEWVWKQDVGTESYTEKEKGRASDSFKRACFNLGIGRELYTAPFIWFGKDYVKIEGDERPTTRDRFRVDDIEYDDRRRIKSVTITNTSRKETLVFYNAEQELLPVHTKQPTGKQFKKLRAELDRTGFPDKSIMELYEIESIKNEMTEGQLLAALRMLEKLPNKS